MISTEVFPIGSASVLLVAAAAIAGVSRGFSGFGGALIFMPLASALVGPTVAVPTFLVCDAIMASALVPTAMRCADWTDVRPILAGAVIGLPLGNWFLTHADPIVVRWSICVAIMLALLVMASGWRVPPRPGLRTRLGVGLTSGLLAGLASIGGPPVIVYWLSTTSVVSQMRSNLLAFFACTSAIALVLFALRGLLTPQVFWYVALCAPGYGVGIWVGTRLFPLASQQTYRWIAYAMVGFSALASLPLLDGVLGRSD